MMTYPTLGGKKCKDPNCSHRRSYPHGTNSQISECTYRARVRRLNNNPLPTLGSVLVGTDISTILQNKEVQKAIADLVDYQSSLRFRR